MNQDRENGNGSLNHPPGHPKVRQRRVPDLLPRHFHEKSRQPILPRLLARGPKAKPVDPRDRRLAELERDNRRLQARLERAEGLIEVQKKVSQLLGIPLESDGKA